MECGRIGSCGRVPGISGAGVGDRIERISGFGRVGDDGDSRRDLDGRKGRGEEERDGIGVRMHGGGAW